MNIYIMRVTTKFDYKFLKEKLGITCINCGTSTEEVKFHHIVPIVLGGFDILTNIVPLCENCHNLVHHATGKSGELNHSYLIKQGLEKAKKEGKCIGRPSLTIENIPQECFEIYQLLESKQINKTEGARKLGCSRPTLYKYLEVIKNYYEGDITNG